MGDELVVRIELRVDRDMEYVHLQDQRGCGTEPVGVISRYRFQDGPADYQSTRDTATHFFSDYSPKRTYVLESSVRVQHRGELTRAAWPGRSACTHPSSTAIRRHALDVR